ncbi:MAG TPA: Fe2+-dependent dioxygenase [Stellaceae bacterium]|jgi:PKHD-type hydroxylase|nr:Fe2+-dependent dioxygenase [Stellaceae bacterium]
MLSHIPGVVKPDQVTAFRALLDRADWVDGRGSAGFMAERVKHNQEVPPTHPAAQQIGAAILGALAANPLFIAVALPLRICPPFFNRYQGGETYGTHNDSALINVPGAPGPVRGDLAATLFLTAPETYDGGELIVEDTYGLHRVKLPAGDLILYPASSLHRVAPVTRGARVSSFFWIQSMVRDDSQRALLVSLDRARGELHRALPDNPAVMQVLNIYHNLLRMWAET